MKRSDPKFAETLLKAYDTAAAGRDGDDPDHPRHAVNGWMQQAQDDINPNATIEDEEIRGDPTTPGGNRAHGRTAIDSNRIALDELRIRQSGSPNVEADLHLARVRRTYDAAGVRRNAAMIPGYDRLK